HPLDARIAVRVTRAADRFVDLEVLLTQLTHARRRVSQLRLTRRVPVFGTTKRIERVDTESAAGERDHGVAAQRKTGGSDAIGIDAAAEQRIREQSIEHDRQVFRPLPDERRTLRKLARLLARVTVVVDGRDDEAA